MKKVISVRGRRMCFVHAGTAIMLAIMLMPQGLFSNSDSNILYVKDCPNFPIKYSLQKSLIKTKVRTPDTLAPEHTIKKLSGGFFKKKAISTLKYTSPGMGRIAKSEMTKKKSKKLKILGCFPWSFRKSVSRFISF